MLLKKEEEKKVNDIDKEPKKDKVSINVLIIYSSSLIYVAC